jgi:GTP-binding protein EngB required for normal cell division
LRQAKIQLEKKVQEERIALEKQRKEKEEKLKKDLLIQKEKLDQEKENLQNQIQTTISTISTSINTNQTISLNQFNKKSLNQKISVLKKVPAMNLSGKNFGFFSKTSTGKSTLINKILGKNSCETGRGEVTRSPKSYSLGIDLNIWDLPGSNGETDYLNPDFISLVKGMNSIGIMIENTVSEMSDFMKCLDSFNISYQLIVNKCDKLKTLVETFRFKQQINNERSTFGLLGCNHVYFISALDSQYKGDWDKFVLNFS